MTMCKSIGVLIVATVFGVLYLAGGERFAVPKVFEFVSTAEAVVGRPVTPMSVAGVARRSARRCAAGVTC
jgi:hypothetical protein